MKKRKYIGGRRRKVGRDWGRRWMTPGGKKN
jgi:hypothetical protein